MTTRTNLGTLQPHEPHHFTMWVVLPDAMTPNDPHPTPAILAREEWLIYPLEAKMDNSRVGIPTAQGGEWPSDRHLSCRSRGRPGGVHRLVSGTPQTINTSDPKNELLCGE
jgi:hypothetical protein